MHSVNAGGKRSRPAAVSGVLVNATPKPKAKPTKPTKKKAAKKPNATTTTPAATTAVVVRRPKLVWRTRDQENSALYNLQLDVAGLQSELQGLRAYHELLMSRALNRHDDRDGSLMRTVQEYFRVFRFGYVSDAQLQRHRLALPRGHHHEDDEIATPDEFLRRVMDEQVWIGRFPGLTQMMKQWARYVSVFGPMTLSFLDSRIVPVFRGSAGQEHVLVISRAKYQLFVSMRTLEIMFPHVLAYPEIVMRVVGRHIRGIGTFHFVFDMAQKRIVRYWISLDLAASFLDLLGDPAMVAVLLQEALITDEYFIGDLSEFVPESPPEAVVFDMDTETKEVEPIDEAVPPSRPSKMAISNILSAIEDDSRDVDMDDSEPYAERGPDEQADYHGNRPQWFMPV